MTQPAEVILQGVSPGAVGVKPEQIYTASSWGTWVRKALSRHPNATVTCDRHDGEIVRRVRLKAHGVGGGFVSYVKVVEVEELLAKDA